MNLRVLMGEGLTDHLQISMDQTDPHNGYGTYSQDFLDVCLPALSQKIYLVETEEDVLFSFGKVIKDFHIGPSVQKILKLQHNDEVDPGAARSRKGIPITILCSYQSAIDKLRLLGQPAFFIPMRINTSRTMPFHAIPNGKWVYFGNSYPEKIKMLSLLKGAIPDLDFVQENKINGQFTEDSVLPFVSQHEYGIGVGRSALEMLCMGMKVLIAGEGLFGALNSEDRFQRWEKENLNGRFPDLLLPEESLFLEMEAVKNSTFQLDPSRVDISLFAEDIIRLAS